MDVILFSISENVSFFMIQNLRLDENDSIFFSIVIFSSGYCGIQYSQAVPYTSPDSFDLSSVTTVSGAANVSFLNT